MRTIRLPFGSNFSQEKDLVMKSNHLVLKRFFFFAVILVLSSCSSARDSAKFAAKAAAGGMAEVELGKLALQRASDPAVKEFAQRMVADHTRANSELKAVALKKNIQLPTDLTSGQKSKMDKLSKLSGAEFDKQYMSDMVKDHEEDVEDFKTQAEQGTDPDVKSFAAKTLPTLQSHLQMAQETAKKVGAK
jgi:putative membrane protein